MTTTNQKQEIIINYCIIIPSSLFLMHLMNPIIIMSILITFPIKVVDVFFHKSTVEQNGAKKKQFITVYY